MQNSNLSYFLFLFLNHNLFLPFLFQTLVFNSIDLKVTVIHPVLHHTQNIFLSVTVFVLIDHLIETWELVVNCGVDGTILNKNFLFTWQLIATSVSSMPLSLVDFCCWILFYCCFYFKSILWTSCLSSLLIISLKQLHFFCINRLLYSCLSHLMQPLACN